MVFLVCFQFVQPWISLEYHAVDSHFTERYHRKMVAEAKNQIPFMMKP